MFMYDRKLSFRLVIENKVPSISSKMMHIILRRKKKALKQELKSVMHKIIE